MPCPTLRTLALAVSCLAAPCAHAAWDATVLDRSGLPDQTFISALVMNNGGGYAVSAWSWPEGLRSYTYAFESWVTLKGANSTVKGMNDLGQIAGDVSDDAGYRGVVWSPSGPRKDFGILAGYGDSQAEAINNAGIVAGGSGGLGWGAHSQAGKPGAITMVIPGDEGSMAFEINNAGIVAGTATVVGEPGKTGVYTAKDGVVTYVAKASYPEVYYYNRARINDRGDVSYNAIFGNAAGFNSLDQVASVRWADGTVQDLGISGFAHSRAWDLNDNGQVVGTVWNLDTFGNAIDLRLAFWEQGVGQLVGEAGQYGGGSVWSNLYALNNAGQILTTRYDEHGQSLVLLTAAVPEPSAWALMLAGVGLLGAVARRRTAA